MKITIHRGINQIGGCATEIQSGDDRIMIDLGSSLPGTESEDFSEEQIKSKTSGLRAILYTHYHGDHVGHFAEVSGAEQWIGKGAHEVMMAKHKALQKASDIKRKNGQEEEADKLDQTAALSVLSEMKTFEMRQELRFGCLTVTPFACSHSAFDSYMFLISDGENTVLHTGDFRMHGYIGKGVRKFIPAFVGQVDALITEGTMLCRGDEHVATEGELKREVYNLLTEGSGHNQFFALCSSTDIDRLATFRLACKEAGAWFVVDSFQKEVLDIFTKYQSGFSKIYNFDRVKICRSSDKFFDEIARTGFVFAIRSSQIVKLKNVYMRRFPNAKLIYSMWNGYRHGSASQRSESIIDVCRLFGDENIVSVHTSGHATPEAIRDVVEMTRPRKKIIVIHKDKNSDRSLLNLPEEYKDKVIWDFEQGQDNSVEI